MRFCNERVVKHATISPAYGNDYYSEQDAIKAFMDGSGFVAHDIDGTAWMGAYVCVADCDLDAVIELRYNKMKSVTVLSPKGVTK
jgi:hypothetical protein